MGCPTYSSLLSCHSDDASNHFTVGVQNFHEECESLINKHINMDLNSSYIYLLMNNYFARDDVALHGFAKYFKKNSDEEREHATKFMDYQKRKQLFLRSCPEVTSDSPNRSHKHPKAIPDEDPIQQYR